MQDYDTTQAEKIAARVLANADLSLDWHLAGYATALDAARVLVGNAESKEIAEMAAAIVADRIDR